MKFIATICLTLCLLTTATAGTLAQFRTVFGDIEVELLDQDKPVTVDNFKKYVQGGFYQNLIFHRWEPGFVLQGGGFYVATQNGTNFIPSVLTFGNITNEFSVGRPFSNTYGTIAMARVSGQTNSANSQFYFNLGNNAFLDQVDGGFTVFGNLISGTNVLNRFITGNGLYRIPQLGSVPLLGTNFTTFAGEISNLVYVDITLLNVHVRPERSSREISWNSATGLVNHVEFTTKLPPQWQTLVATNGTGADMSVVDLTPTNQFRFYRVTVGPK